MKYQLVNGVEDCEYRFVYDDIDRSVKYRSVLSIDAEHTIIFKGYKNISKLRLFGFEYYDLHDCYLYDICRYAVSGDKCVDVVLYLRVLNNNNFCYLGLRLYNSSTKVPFGIIRKGTYGFYDMSFYKLELQIPPEMVDYILNLKSVHDFDGIMSAFDNLTGSRLNEIMYNMEVRSIDFQYWINEG